MKPDAVADYLRKVGDVLEQTPRRGRIEGALDPLDRLIEASARKADPMAFLDDALALYGRKGVSVEALTVLAEKARNRRIDLGWLRGRTQLDDWLLDFLARNNKTPWRSLRRASLPNASDFELRYARGAVRGKAGEFLPLLPLTQGELAVRSGIIDYQPELQIQGGVVDYVALAADGRLHGVEIKAWGSRYCGEVASALQYHVTRNLADPDSLARLESLDRLVNQLWAMANSANGVPPVLVMSDALLRLSQRRQTLLRAHILLRGPPGTQIIFISEDEIKMISREFQRQLDIPP